jgi:S1-C subfamily serine protease
MTTPNPLEQFSDQLAALASAAGEAVVLVNGRERLPASGIVISGTQVLTANHVLERSEDLSIRLSGGQAYPAAIAGRDPRTDLALLTVEGSLPPAAAPANARVGELALLLGRPDTSGIQASLGIVAGTLTLAWGGHRRRRESRPAAEQYLRVDGTSYPGFSGGPLVNMSGGILGINTSGLMQGAAIALPFARASEIAAQLGEHGSVRRGYLGIRSQQVELTMPQQARLARQQASGLLLVWLEEGSPAAQAGLLVGDIIVGLGGEPVADHTDLQHALLGEAVGTATPAEILRGGEPMTVEVTIGHRAD